MYRLIAVVAQAALLLALPFSSALAVPTKFDHIVIIVQENRTPDNLFHGLNKVLPAADIADVGVNSKGEKITLKPISLANAYDLGHSHGSFVAMYDNGKMDGADKIECFQGQGACPANAQFRYAELAEVAPYRAMAVNYGFANRMFQTNQGPSFPAHQFLFGGTSQLNPYSPLFAAENPANPQPGTAGGGLGCNASPNETVATIGPNREENIKVFPCFEHQTLADLLDRPPHNPKHPISWRYYTESAIGLWTAPNAIRHLCEPSGNPPQCSASPWSNGEIVVWPPQILADIDHNRLATVSWVIPTAQDSDHANTNQGTGPSWVASIVNAIGHSAYWKSTAILITWDDWGGWYDHVPPPAAKAYNYYELGFRVPLLVVSPFTPAGYVSQSQHDFGSILRFVETAFDLGRIPPGTFADARADDLSDFFDFSKPPRAFVPIPTKVPASRFLDRSRPMLPPDDD